MKVLAINKSYIPIRICSKFATIGKMYTGAVESFFIKDGSYRPLNWADWLELSKQDVWPEGTDFINSVTQRVALPKVIRYLNYDKVPRVSLKLTRKGIYERDNHTCYICGENYGEGKLSVDHVKPLSKGGQSTWENLVTCCKKCNGLKGDKTLEELKWKPKFLPYRPARSNIQKLKASVTTYYPEWKLFGF